VLLGVIQRASSGFDPPMLWFDSRVYHALVCHRRLHPSSADIQTFELLAARACKKFSFFTEAPSMINARFQPDSKPVLPKLAFSHPSLHRRDNQAALFCPFGRQSVAQTQFANFLGSVRGRGSAGLDPCRYHLTEDRCRTCAVALRRRLPFWTIDLLVESELGPCL